MIENVSVSDAHSLRKTFLDKFTTKSVPQYRSVMGHGDFYGVNGHKGFLWEIIRPYKVISEKIALEIVSQKDEIFVMWDRPLRGTNRELQKTRMIKTSGLCLVNNIKPFADEREMLFRLIGSNFYVFDREMSFHVTFTGENLSGFGRICITSIENLENDGVSPVFREIFEHYGLGKL